MLEMPRRRPVTVAVDADVKICPVVVVSAACQRVLSVGSEDQRLLIGADIRVDVGIATVDLRPEFLRLLVFPVGQASAVDMKITGYAVAVRRQIHCSIGCDRWIRIILCRVYWFADFLRIAPVVVDLIHKPNVPIASIRLRFRRTF